ncbi:hypothetical protein [Lacrimispora sp. BS-2]
MVHYFSLHLKQIAHKVYAHLGKSIFQTHLGKLALV